MCFSQSTPWTTDVHVSFRLNRPGMGSAACPGRLVSQFLCDSLPTYIVGGRREINRDSIPSEATQIGNYPQKLVPHNFDGKTNLDWMTPLVCIPTMPPFSSLYLQPLASGSRKLCSITPTYFPRTGTLSP